MNDELNGMLKLVPHGPTFESDIKYNVGAVYGNAVIQSRGLMHEIQSQYAVPPASAEANQMAQEALSALEARLGPTGPVQTTSEAPKENIGDLIKEVTGEYRIAQAQVA